MSDPITIGFSALAAFNQAQQIIKALLGLKIDSEVLAHVTKLQSELAAAQLGYLDAIEKNTALVTSKNDLEKEITQLKAWANEKQRYKLTQIQTGVYACVLKESEANGEPPHWICADCYNKGKRFILSKNRESYRDKTYKCTECGFSASIHDSIVPKYL
jgi:DNA-directed RNA polymerase subunit M/transcription elongation factor TFIIS